MMDQIGDTNVFRGKRNRPCTSDSIFPKNVSQRSGSSQADPRHPENTAYRCFLPDLTGFTAFRRVGPNSQHRQPLTEAFRRWTSGRSSASLERIASTGHRYLPA